nr:unnamed protein product [Callosobruchus analis]CAI5861674.1 unnamed protein product [Callosobruchus analis]
MPNTQEDWLQVSEEFEQQWNFPHAIGAIDGKHVAMQCPGGSGSDYFNYKSFFSIVLFALVDANYNFLFADVGCQGRISDGGDEAFALNDNLMKPYSGFYEKGSKQRIFNYRLSRARRVVENAFGICSTVFRVLRKPLLLKPENAQLVVMACVHLHNYLRKSPTSKHLYCPDGALDSEENGQVILGTWRNDNQTSSLFNLRNVPRKSSKSAQEIRNEFSTHFVGDGSVPWQTEYA